MPTLVLLSLFGLLLLAVLLLVVALYLLDSHADEQSKRLQCLLNQRTRSLDETPTNFNHQTCHICGGMRGRAHGMVTTSVSDVKSHESSRSSSHWVAMREKFTANLKLVFQRLVSFYRSQTKGDINKYMCVLGSLSSTRTSFKKREMDDFPLCSEATSASVASSGSKSCVKSASPVTSGRSIAQLETIRAGPSVALTSSMGPLQSSSACMESTQNTIRPNDDKNSESELKSAPFRRLVLEILMSPSANGDRLGNALNDSSVRLKLQTNATVEHLASLTNASDLALEMKNTQQSEKDVKNVNVARLLCLPVRSNTTDRSQSHLEQYSSLLSQSVDMECSLPEAGISSLELPRVESSAVGDLCVNAIMHNGECAHAGQRVGTLASGCLSGPGQKICGDCGLESVHSILSASATGSTLQHSVSNGKVKLRMGKPNNPGNLVSQSSTDDKGQYSFVSEGTSFVSLDGLGSLRITLLKADPDGKLSEEGSSTLSAQVASALAALNVDSAFAKVGGGGVSANIHKEEFRTSNAYSGLSISSPHKSQDEILQGDGSDSDHGVDEVEEGVLLQASKSRSLEGDGSNSKRKEKKKKKNRGKKQKGKVGAVISEAQERQEIGKIALEAAKHVSAVPETEVGCVCGASKGAMHSNSCPYPFTSSGSMLQRKIKEQYDELVRSNVAKTLTLAQVGRFTTCLVEAKAALQQKSELIQRRFTITKSLLAKADKSSFDRLCGQIYGLEMEQKKLEEDTVVYNRLQEQLKLSPAYKKMLEYGRTHFELQPHTGQMIEKLEPEDTEMSFEELLAQEKKDAFWQKHGLSKPSVQVQ